MNEKLPAPTEAELAIWKSTESIATGERTAGPIAAIKAYRARTGAGLYETKLAFEKVTSYPANLTGIPDQGKQPNASFTAHGVWIRTRGEHIEVLVQVGRSWRLIYTHGRDFSDQNESHIVEPAGILNAPEDT